MLRTVFRNIPFIGRLAPRPPSPPRPVPTEGFNLLHKSTPLEEEGFDYYRPERFYPVRLGEVFKSKYQVIGKLGFGGHSTAWLCRDLSQHRYVTVKVCESNSVPAKRELATYLHIKSLWTAHAGRTLVRSLLDHFELQGQDENQHICLVHEPLSFSVETIRLLDPAEKLELSLVKVILQHMLHALDFLHTAAGVVHGDLQAMNIHCRLEQDDKALQVFEEAAFSQPVDRKVDGDRIIYRSQGMTMPEKLGRPILCDLGEARMGEESYNELLQPVPYRSPEVILGIPWTYSADIWNVAQLAWVMVEGKLLFTGKDEDGEPSYGHHLAQTVAILGLPPTSLLERSKEASQYFDRSGSLLASYRYPKEMLEGRLTQVDGDVKAGFLTFIRKMLCWAPEERQTAEQLLQDPWLNS